MKSAKEMFEELGYERYGIYEDMIVWRTKTEVPHNSIYFYDKNNIEILGDFTLNVKEIKAINKQIEELKWNE